MSVIAAPEGTSVVSDLATGRNAPRRELRSSRPLQEDRPEIFTLMQRYFVVGGQHLVLDEYPQIAVYPGRFEFEVVGWQIRLPYGRQDEIGREMIRKFLRLHAKAEQLDLNEQEEAEWAEIVKHVDYRRFSVDRSPPRYVDGVLLERNEGACKVRWHDGTTERITGGPMAALSLLEPGERFVARARFGEHNILREITNLLPMPPADGADGERMWQEWPVKE